MTADIKEEIDEEALAERYLIEKGWHLEKGYAFDMATFEEVEDEAIFTGKTLADALDGFYRETTVWEHSEVEEVYEDVWEAVEIEEERTETFVKWAENKKVKR